MKHIPGTIKILMIVFSGWLILSVFLHADNTRPAVKTVPVAVKQKEIKKLAEGYKQQEEKLNSVEHNISSKLIASKKKLSQQRAKSNRLLHELEGITTKLCNGADSLLCSGDGDTLIEKVAEVVRTEAVKDSICDEVIGQQQQLLNNKDSLIALGQQQNESWKKIIKEDLRQQDLLVSENRLYRKQAKRLKTKKTILSGAVIALSALLIKSIIK